MSMRVYGANVNAKFSVGSIPLDYEIDLVLKSRGGKEPGER